jgi:hypothetical protein
LTKTLTAAAVHALRVVTVSDIAAADLESIIDQAIGIVNTEVGLDIGYLAGEAGSKTVTVEDEEFAIVSTLTLILAINALLSTEDTSWTVVRRNNAAELAGNNGFLTMRYNAMVESIKSGASETGAEGIALLSWNDPLPE